MTNPQQPYQQQPGETPYGGQPGQPGQPGHPGQPVQPGQPMQNPYAGSSPNKAGVGFAVTALILGIIAFLSGLIPVVGMVWGLAALIFGFIALKKKQNKVMSIIGLVGGGLGFITSLLMLILIIAGGGEFSWGWSTY